MFRKIEAAIGVFDGVTAPHDGVEVEVSWQSPQEQYPT